MTEQNKHDHDSFKSRFKAKDSLILLLSGFGSGLLVTYGLTPYDKGLYLSVTENRKFLDIRNFRNPYQGAGQSLFQKSVSNGLYFPFEHFAYSMASNHLQLGNRTSSIIGGTFAGALNALLLNPVAAIKYTRWSEATTVSLKHAFVGMYKQGGMQQFFKGMYATMSRDIIFGSSFAYLRYLRRDSYKQNGLKLNYRNKLWIDVSSGFVATILSSPFNFVRNMQYATAKNEIKIPSMKNVLQTFYSAGLQEATFMDTIKFWMFRLRIGWGTARVAVGMGITSSCYEFTNTYLLNHHDI